MSDSDKQALLDGSATIQTEIVVHNENLFDKNNANLINGYLADAGTLNAGNANRTLYIPCQSNTTYTISKIRTYLFRVAEFSDEPTIGASWLTRTKKDNSTTMTFTTTTGNYLAVTYYDSNNDTLTEQEILNSIQIEEGTPVVLTEDNSVISWNHEDFRYVKDEGWIGQFVARQLTGELKNLDDDFKITDKEITLRLGVRVNDNTTWYSLGNFLVTKVTDDEVKDITSFEALDYTKKFNKLYEDTITYPCTALELAQNVCSQCGVELATTEFANSNYIINGNPFTNNETCRDVMKAIGKLAFSWVRIDWDDKVYIDFTRVTDVSEYDNIDNSKYYNLKTQKEVFGPVDKIIIGYSQIEGERTYIGDEHGVNELTIYDNPLVYTQEQRESVIVAAETLLGLTYTPLNMLTIGHPWLKGKELIEVVDMEGVSHNTIPFDRTIQYFGHIKTLIDVATQTKTNTEYAYDANIANTLQRTEIRVNKAEGEIEEIIERTFNADRDDSLISIMNRTIRSMYDIQNIFQITGGNNIIKNSQFLLPDETWEFTDNGTNPYHTPFSGGYDDRLIGQTVANAKIRLQNIIASTKIDNINNLIIGQTYTLNYYYKQDDQVTTTVELIDNILGTTVWSDTYSGEETRLTNVEYQFVAQHTDYTFKVTTATTSGQDGYFYLYDLMLNSGDKKTWEPAASEVYSTILQMSREGLKVISTGSNTTTLLNAGGFQIKDTSTDEIITTFDNTGMVTKSAKMTDVEIDKYIMKTMTIRNKDHHVEYFGG